LNDTLHLTGRGIQELKSLEPYLNVLSIHLTANAIRSLNGLQSLRKLRSLHISNNSLTSLKGIENLTELRFLDVSNNNRLECIDALANHDSIEILLCGNNKRLRCIEALSTCSSLTSIDCRDCGISGTAKEENERILGVICSLRCLASLNLNGNPIMAQITEPFRTFCISKAPALQNLNDIPVSSKERRISEAYMHRGGRDAAREEKQNILEEEEREREEQWEWFREMIQIEKEAGL
jgi:Leucine-rich repeat (LRR) protein